MNPRLLIFDEVPRPPWTTNRNVSSREPAEDLPGQDCPDCRAPAVDASARWQIIVLERELVESGSHEDLMGKQGLYHYLYSQQERVPV